MSVDVDALAKAIAEAAEEYEKQYGHPPSKARVTLSKAEAAFADQVAEDWHQERQRISKADEAREDLDTIARVVRHHHPELSHAQVVTKALEAYPQLYDEMVT